MAYMLRALVLDILLYHLFAIHFFLQNNFFFVVCVQPPVLTIAEILPHYRCDLRIQRNVCLLDLFCRLFYDDVFVLDDQITREL